MPQSVRVAAQINVIRCFMVFLYFAMVFEFCL